MIFSEHSGQFKLLLFCVWIMPYASLFLWHRDGKAFFCRLFYSKVAVVLFILSFAFIVIIGSDYYLYRKGLESLTEVWTEKVPRMLFFFPGLVFVILLTSINAIKRDHENDTGIFIVMIGVAHVLYSINIAFRVFEVNLFESLR